jgi:hypothetical protein
MGGLAGAAGTGSPLGNPPGANGLAGTAGSTGGTGTLGLAAGPASAGGSSTPTVLGLTGTDTTPPMATLNAPNVTGNNAALLNPYTFTVAYSDPVLVSGASLSGTVVQVQPPGGGALINATAVSTMSSGVQDGMGDALTETVTYQFTPPGGDWSSAPNGTYTVSLSASPPTDLAGNAVAVGPLGAFTVTLGPKAASLALSGPSGATAGKGFLLTVQANDALGNPTNNFNGIVSFTTTDPHGSVPPPMMVTGGFGIFLATLNTVTPGAPGWTITATSGTFTSTSAPITVTPGPAVKLSFAAQPVNTPTGVALPGVTVQVLDAAGNVITGDNTDAVTLGVASGPPGAPGFTAGSTTTVNVHNGVATFSNLTLVAPGTYTLSALVPSLYTGPASSAFTVAPLQVVPGSFAGSPSGFSLQFNAPFLVNSTTPVLFGQGFAAGAPVPSVTLTGPSGPVEGSLVLDTASNRITFVETDTASVVNNGGSPVLPDGTYTVDVRSSGATGFQALGSGGGYLDGHGTGVPGSGDFTATFTVSAAADDVVWLPATADGPGQPLEAPGNNQIGGGYPVNLNTASFSAPVTDVQATLSYNPALLTVTPTSTTTFTVTVPTVGTAQVHYHGVGLNGTQVALGVLTATVPSGTAATPVPYKAKDLLHLSGVTINGSASNVATGDALHLVAYVGDADGNGNYSSSDAVLLTRVALQTDSGFPAYPLVDPVIVGDTDGSGFIPADAALQINEAGVGFATATLPNPPIPGSVVFQAIPNNVDPTLSLEVSDQRSEVSSPRIMAVAVNIDDAHPEGSTGLIEGHLALTYDPSRYTVSAADVHPGSVLAGGNWTILPSIDQATGELAVALSSNTPIRAAIGGSLVTIDFHPVTADSGTARFQLVAWASPNGQYIRTELQDAQGAFTLTPAPTNAPAGGSVATVLLSPVPVASVVNHPLIASATAPERETQDGEPPVRDVPPTPTVTMTLDALAQESQAGVIGPVAEPLHSLAPGPVRATIPWTPFSPLLGWVFQIAPWAGPSAPSGMELAAGPPSADPLFRALGGGIRANSEALASMTRPGAPGPVEQVLADLHWLLPSFLDNQKAAEMTGDLDRYFAALSEDAYQASDED